MGNHSYQNVYGGKKMVRESIKNEVPELWRQRYNAGLCPVCGKDKSDFNKNMRVYCSPKCRDEYAKKFTSWTELREKVLKRDNETCTICGINSNKFMDIKKVEERRNFENWIKNNPEEVKHWRDVALVKLSKSFEEDYERIKDDIKFLKRFMDYDEQRKLEVTKWGFGCEVDHIKAVALGGAMWDENNLQTLCKECHKLKTRKDRKKISINNLKKGNKNVGEFA